MGRPKRSLPKLQSWKYADTEFPFTLQISVADLARFAAPILWELDTGSPEYMTPTQVYFSTFSFHSNPSSELLINHLEATLNVNIDDLISKVNYIKASRSKPSRILTFGRYDPYFVINPLKHGSEVMLKSRKPKRELLVVDIKSYVRNGRKKTLHQLCIVDENNNHVPRYRLPWATAFRYIEEPYKGLV